MKNFGKNKGENFMRKIATFIVCLFAVLNAAEIISVGEVSLTGGSSMYEGSSSQSGGNFNLAFVPAVKFNEKVSLLPGYYATYRGSKSVYELIGGGTLYQDMMSHNITLRLINKISPHTKFKVRAGYLLNYFRETKDEDWGEGLFDYSKLTGGIEIEKKTAFFEKFILSLDILKVTFPEYASLASEQYGKEVYPGENILDFSGIMLYARILKRLGEKSILSMNATFTMKDFPEQNIILKDASFSLDKRKDRTTYINTVFSKSLSSIFSLGISASGIINRSNQNHYDAAEYKFVERFYDYNSYSCGPVFSVGKKIRFDINYQYGIKNYKGRLAQDKDGNYTDDKVKNTSNYASLTITYPVRKNLKLKISGNYYSQSSNQDYEAVYEYNYNTSSFEAGVVYEF